MVGKREPAGAQGLPLSEKWSSISALLDMTRLHEAELHVGCAWLMLLVGAVVLAVELGGWVPAMYGRYSPGQGSRWLGPLLPAWTAWVFQESWSVTVALALIWFGDPACMISLPNQVLGAMFLTHYVYRAFIYPFRMRGGKPMPLIICLLASTFCAFNGYLQARLWTHLHVYTIDSASDVLCLTCGATMWLAGWYINLDSDAILRNLRKPGETGYKIPRGGMFEYVSGANYLGEFIEWSGYAIASHLHIGCVAFALFTFCNTGPRAFHHHQWYREKFKGEYPENRRALFPFIA